MRLPGQAVQLAQQGNGDVVPVGDPGQGVAQPDDVELGVLAGNAQLLADGQLVAAQLVPVADFLHGDVVLVGDDGQVLAAA